MLDLSEFLTQLRQQNPVLGLALERLQDSVNHLGVVTGNDPTGMIEDAPTPPQSLQVSAGGGLMHVAVTDGSARSRPLHYFVEVDTDPAFSQPHKFDLGAGSEALLPLPNKDSSGNQLNYHVRAYSMLPGSKRASSPVVLGGQSSPTAVQVGGATQLTLQQATGGGTASPSGRQGGSGFGPTMLTPEEPTIASQVSQGVNAAGGGNVQPGTFAVGGFNPGQVSWLEDFTILGNLPTAQTTVSASQALGDKGFFLIGFTTSTSGVVAAGVPHFVGYAYWVNNGTASSKSILFPAWTYGNSGASAPNFADWNTNALPLFDYTGWQVSFIFRLNLYLQSTTPTVPFSMAKKAMYVGLHGINPNSYLATNNSSRPTTFFGVRYDTSTTSPSINDKNLTLDYRLFFVCPAADTIEVRRVLHRREAYR